MDPKKLMEALIAALLPTLNDELTQLIRSQGLDPWGVVYEGSTSLGKINLGICKAKAKAKYKIKNMTGLASTEITSIRIINFNAADPNNITGALAMDARLTQKLKAQVSGKVKAGCGGLKDSVGIKGDVIAKGVVAKGQGTFTASLNGQNGICLKSAKLTKFGLDYNSLNCTINNLGIFNEFLKALEDAIDAIFGQLIKGEIANALKPLFNSLLKDLTPYCYP